MLAEFINKVTELKRPETIKPYPEGGKYMIEGYEPIMEPTASIININTLTGLIDYLRCGVDFGIETKTMYFIHITEYNQAIIRSELLGPFRQRESLMCSSSEAPKLSSHWMDVEEFIINLNSKFVHSCDYEYLVKLVSGMTQQASKELKDNGVSQSTVVRNGVSIVEEMKIKNPIILQPFRTFPEIEQPEIEYIFRLRETDGPPSCALFEADGGRWKLETMHRIKTWIESRLQEEGLHIEVIA